MILLPFIRGIILGFLLLIFLGGCATYTISPDDLATQLRENQKRSEYFGVPNWLQFYAILFLTDLSIERNGIKRIVCINSEGGQVYLSIDHTTQLELYLKSTTETKKMYFDTVLLLNNELIGHMT